MPAVIDLIEEKITKSEVLYGVSWEMYENLLEKYRDENTPRFTYDSGVLEIETMNSVEHEEDNRILAKIVELLLEESNIDYRNLGSPTYKKKTLRKGFEPDSCFYIQSLDLIEGKTKLDFEKDAPPDLIIEINRTSSSVARMPIFAAFGVPELWRFENETVKFYALEQGVYIEVEKSLALPVLSDKVATEFLLNSREMKKMAWIKKIREWFKESEIVQ